MILFQMYLIFCKPIQNEFKQFMALKGEYKVIENYLGTLLTTKEGRRKKKELQPYGSAVSFLLCICFFIRIF